MLDSKVARSRSKAYSIRLDNPEKVITKNYIGSAIEKLAKYGIFLRDSKDKLTNYILSVIQKNYKRYQTIGNEDYIDKRSSTAIGDGKERNLDLKISREHGKGNVI